MGFLDTNVFYPHIKENRPWDIEEMDWYDLREHANTMSDFIQKLYNYILKMQIVN